MLRLIYLISVALNICGHMCLYCVVGEILIAQVSITMSKTCNKKMARIMISPYY